MWQNVQNKIAFHFQRTEFHVLNRGHFFYINDQKLHVLIFCNVWFPVPIFASNALSVCIPFFSQLHFCHQRFFFAKRFNWKCSLKLLKVLIIPSKLYLEISERMSSTHSQFIQFIIWREIQFSIISNFSLYRIANFHFVYIFYHLFKYVSYWSWLVLITC